MFTLVVNDVAAIRFKKVDRDLQTSNHPTGQALAYKRQEEVPLLSDLAHLEIGYQLDITEQRIQAIFVLCPNGEHDYYWVAELTEESADSVVSDFFDARPQVDDAIDESVVRPRRGADVVPFKRNPADESPSR
ncbi:MAG: hypothetical protein DI564_00725 [Rhodanobacter denitrificans]|uniref:Uncharacterized protein n=1 Tax=Rhodanobacter denitrificans TaxID=666685 RepID=A0A2W5N181_9GAMM|nr:MAG: hypothetical protein DI564_00725 [Rhodanobacter denitrificans]